MIFLADQADVSAAYEMKDQDARGWFVYNTLTEHAARTQTGIKALLDSRGISYQSFWAANMLVALADRPTVDLLAARSDVARVDSNKPARWIEDPNVATWVSPDVPAIDGRGNVMLRRSGRGARRNDRANQDTACVGRMQQSRVNIEGGTALAPTPLQRA